MMPRFLECYSSLSEISSVSLSLRSGISFANFSYKTNSREKVLMKKKSIKPNPLSKAQNKLLKVSLKRLLGNGLLEEPDKKESELKAMVLKNALNAIVLE